MLVWYWWWCSYNSIHFNTTFHFLLLADLFGRGLFSFSISMLKGELVPRQFPLTGPLLTELNTRKTWVFLRNSCALGLSWVPPLCLWHPKNFSNGSWHILWLRKECTPGMVKRYCTSSMNDFVVKYTWKFMMKMAGNNLQVKCFANL